MASLHAQTRVTAREVARRDVLERQLARFHRKVRERVRAVAEQHPHLKDLALSFPALLVALAVPRAGYDRVRACRQVVNGAPLRDLAKATRIPLWLRKLPPEGFAQGIPWLPTGDMFSRQIPNHIPKSPAKIGEWLEAISRAARLADDVAALWVAREWVNRKKRGRHDVLHWICLWSWFARRVPDDPCRLDTAWSQSLAFREAARLAFDWRENVLLYVELGDGAVDDMWLAPANVGGFDFVPLRTYQEIQDEARAMRHCVRTYASCLAENSSRIWSIRRGGELLATLELHLPCDSPYPNIVQIKRRNNAQAPAGFWRIAHLWMRSQVLAGVSAGRDPNACVPVNFCAWRKMWRPYWIAKRCVPSWLPLAPPRHVVDYL